ncbi:MAG: hypothetical protein WKF97_04435 [Chitinophagaceae bacterium]
MSKIFAEEAHRNGIRYYHLWAQDFSDKEAPLFSSPPVLSPDVISIEIMNLYQKEPYNTEMAIQSFPKQLLHQHI